MINSFLNESLRELHVLCVAKERAVGQGFNNPLGVGNVGAGAAARGLGFPYTTLMSSASL